MTTTAVLNAVSAGTGSNVGETFNPTKTALQATTTGAKISVAVTLASGGEIRTDRIRVFFAVSPTSYGSATIGAAALRQGAEQIEIVPVSLEPNSLVVEKSSDMIPCAAGYAYVWVQMPGLTGACTITVSLQEIP